jgi:hypothetical protein
MNRHKGRSFCWTALLLIVAFSAPHAFAETPRPSAPSHASFEDVIEMVRQHGWRVNLGHLCAEFNLSASASGCAMQQVSVEDVEDQSYPRGFNVPSSGDAATDVLLFHLNPLIGEFFVVSSEGNLKAAFVRSKGTGYDRVANEVVRDEFERDVAYWKRNFSRVKQGLTTTTK